MVCLPQLTHCLGIGSCPNHRLLAIEFSYALERSMSTPRSRRTVVDEETILGDLRSGEDLPDYDYEDFEIGSIGQDRRGEDPGRDIPRGRDRYVDDGDDRIFRQVIDDEQARRVYSDRSGSESGHRHGRFD